MKSEETATHQDLNSEVKTKRGPQKYKPKHWSEFLDTARSRQGAEQQSARKSYEEEIKADMRQYDEDHSEELSGYYGSYLYASSQKFAEKYYVPLSAEKLDSELLKCNVMILTANPIEKAILHAKASEHNKSIYRILGTQNEYYIFEWGAYRVAHAHQGETGSFKDMGSNSTINDALLHFTPNVIISLGVAFGIDHTSQQLGDVLVSKRILPYSENKLDDDKLIPDRGQDKTIDSWLHVRLQSTAEFFNSVNNDDNAINVTYGDILTGGSVLSSLEEKDKICMGYSKSDFVIGGEMEGNAVFQTAKRVGIPGVVIKGICDWGVLKNGIYPEEPEREEKLKDSLQALAMSNAIKKCSMLLNEKWTFSTSKNAADEELKRQNKIAMLIVVVSQFLLFAGSFCFIFLKNISNEFFQNVIAIICMLLALAVLISSVYILKLKPSWKKKSVNKHLKGTKSEL